MGKTGAAETDTDLPALLGGTPVRTAPFIPLRRTPGDLQRLEEVLDQVDWGGIPYPHNPMHRRFSEAFERKMDGAGALLVANGSIAISIALRALGLRAGDEVLVPALTWVATASAAIHMNLVPVLVDVEQEHYCLDPRQIDAAVTEKTRAIVVVHLAHQVADMDAIMAVSRRHNLLVVEDCAHAHFARWRGRPVGTIGDAGTFSFEGSKIMTSGEGGAIVSRRPEIVHRAMSLANVGRKEPPYDQFEGRLLGFNGRASELQAAILLGQIEHFDQHACVRRENLSRLLDGLRPIGGLDHVEADTRASDSPCYEVLFRYDPAAFKGLSRHRFCEAARVEGVEIEGHFYDPLHQSALMEAASADWPALRNRYGKSFDGRGLRFPVAEKAAQDELVWIHHSLLSGGPLDIDDIVAAVAKIQRHAEALT